MAQQKGHFFASVTPGFMHYQGDISGDFPELRTTHLFCGFDFGYQPGKIFSFALGYSYGKISGADSLVSGKEKRNFQFYSHIHDFHLVSYVNLSAISRKSYFQRD